MWRGTSGAQSGVMFTNYEITRVLVSEHQRDLERSAARTRAARVVRRIRRSKTDRRS
jgi:hypothetical protein